jgi:hypothetical protein
MSKTSSDEEDNGNGGEEKRQDRFITVRDCFKRHITIEKRLSYLEVLVKTNLFMEIGAILIMVATLIKIFTSG